MPVDDKAHINPLGFREYDARWLYRKDINNIGIENLGRGFGSQIIKHTQKKNPRIIDINRTNRPVPLTNLFGDCLVFLEY